MMSCTRQASSWSLQAGINALAAEHSEIGGVLLLSHPMLG